MKHLRLSLPVLALVLAGTWAHQATACDKDKATAATAAHASCSAEMAAACTPEMAAACKANKSTKTSAVTAASTAASPTAKTASMDCCAMKSAKTATASSKTAKTAKTTAVAASEGGCLGMMDAAIVTAAGPPSSGKVTAVPVGSGGQCSSKSSSTASRTHGDCDACADMLLCNGELETAGTRTQVVPLKNGVMFVYTAEEPGKVNAVQSAMARRSQRLSQIVTAGDRAQLCSDCKMMRGAIASGKMTREVINIEGGALTLMTSTDPAMVKKIRSLVDGNKIARAKS